MGECDPPYNIEEWIPHYFDLIAVGVQECMRTPFFFVFSTQAFLSWKLALMA